MMLVLVSYDVSTVEPAGRRRLRRIAKECANFGRRVQNSVFECAVDPGQLSELKHRLLEIFDPAEDSLRFYMLGSNWSGSVEHWGTKHVGDVRDPLIL